MIVRLLLFVFLLQPAFGQEHWHLPFQQKANWGLQDGNGTILLKPIYDEVRLFGSNVLLKKNGVWEVLNNNLKPLGLTQLTDIGEEKYFSFREQDYYQVKSWEKIGLLSLSNAGISVPVLYDSILHIAESGFVYTWQNDRQGLYNVATGKLLDCKYDEVKPFTTDAYYNSENYAFFRLDSLWGIADQNATELVPAAYQQISVVGTRTFVLKQNKGYGYLLDGDVQACKWHGIKTIDEVQGYVGVKNKAGRWLIARNGLLLNDKAWAQVKLLDKQLIVQQNRKWGALDSTGEQLVPCEWNEVIPVDSIYIVRDRKYGLHNGSELLTECVYDRISRPVPNVLFLTQTEKKGWATLDGTLSHAAEFDYLSIENGNILVSKDNYEGLYSLEGEEIIPPKYTSIGDSEYGIYRVRTEDGWTLVDSAGALLLNDTYDRLQIESATAGTGWKGQQRYDLDLDDTQENPITHYSIKLYTKGKLLDGSKDSLRMGNMLWLRQDDLWGLTDSDASAWFIPPKYNQIKPIYDLDMVLTRTSQVGLVKVSTAEEILSNRFSTIHIEDWEQGELARVESSDLQWFFLNKAGKLRSLPNAVFLSEWQDGVCIAWYDGPTNKLTNRNYTKSGYPNPIILNNLMRKYNERQYLFALFGEDGKYIYPAFFSEVRNIENGFIPVKRGSWGLLHKSKKWSVEPQFSNIGQLKNGMMPVYIYSRGWNVINTQGNFLSEQYFADVEVLSEDYWMTTSRKLIRYGEYKKWYGLLTVTGEVVLENNYEIKVASSSQFLLMERDRKLRLRTNDYNWISDSLYGDIGAPNNGLIAVKSNGRYGYQDLRGNWVIQPIYYRVRSFSNGVAWVSTGMNRYRLINTRGEVLTEDRNYYSVRNFENGLGQGLYKGKMRTIDTEGKHVIALLADKQEEVEEEYDLEIDALHNYYLLDGLGSTLAGPIRAKSILYLDYCQLYQINQPGYTQYMRTDGSLLPLSSLSSTK